MELYLRRALPADAAALAAVELASWRVAYRGLMPDAFLDSLSEEETAARWHENLLKHGLSGPKRVVVAVVEQRIIGFVRVGAGQTGDDPGLIYLLYVQPEYWGRGVGQQLMSAALDELRELGVTQASLWVLHENQRARRFYEAQGWREDGRCSTDRYGGIELAALCYRRAIGN